MHSTQKVWDAQKKALNTRLVQAIGAMPVVSGYGTEDKNKIASSAAEIFLIEGLSKVFKISNICSYSSGNDDYLQDCGLSENILTIDGNNTIQFPISIKELLNSYNTSSYGIYFDTAAVGFETANGESIALYYNPYCKNYVEKNGYYAQMFVCANFIYDVNGPKSPNQMGKDIGFATVLYKNNSYTAAPFVYLNDAPDGKNYTYEEASGACRDIDEDLRLPDIEELTAIYYNRIFLNLSSGFHWSGSAVSAGNDGYAWNQGFGPGARVLSLRSDLDYVRCVWK